MLIYFQKRFDGIYRLTSIWVRISFKKNIRITIWVSNGLREFWEIATVLRLAARAWSKQYCLSDAERSRGRASCIALASLKIGAPKLSAALNFLWLLSLFQGVHSKKVKYLFIYLIYNCLSDLFW